MKMRLFTITAPYLNFVKRFTILYRIIYVVKLFFKNMSLFHTKGAFNSNLLLALDGINNLSDMKS